MSSLLLGGYFPSIINMEGQNQSISLLESIWHNANQIVGAKGFPSSHKRVCVDLIRRVKLILPFLEEVRESQDSSLQEASISAFYALEKALCSALRLLQFCKDGSKLYLVWLFPTFEFNFHPYVLNSQTF